MQEYSLPSPNIGGRGHQLRRIAAQAMSYIEVNANPADGYHSSATDLRAFFVACRDALDTYVGNVVDPVPNTIDAPTATRTTPDGEAPEVDLLITANTYAGYYVRVERSPDGLKEPTGEYTNPSLSVRYQLNDPNLTNGISAAEWASVGYTSPSGLYYQQYRIEREDGVVSPWSNELSDTVVASIATWATTTGTDKNQYVTVNGLNMVGDWINSQHNVRSTTGPSSDKVHVEYEITHKTSGAGANGFMSVGFIGPNEDLSGLGLRPGLPGEASGAALGMYHTGTDMYLRGADPSAQLVMTQPLAIGDIIVLELDNSTPTAPLLEVWVLTPDGQGGYVTQALGQHLVDRFIPTEWRLFAGVYNADSVTVNAGATPFARTPTTGFNIYG